MAAGRGQEEAGQKTWGAAGGLLAYFPRISDDGTPTPRLQVVAPYLLSSQSTGKPHHRPD
jgi:hypothetical protein